jgi:S-DNA-T family DNA segregation ATPase FtsK/SpoIIIE
VEGIVCLAAGSVLALSFVSYVPEHSPTNYVGPLGYWVANLLIQCFGLAAYLFPLVLSAGAIALFVQRAGMASPVRGVGAVALLLEAAILLGLYRPEIPPEHAGGWIGGFIATLMQDAMGLVGSTVVLAALGLLICIMLTGRPLSEVLGTALGAIGVALRRAGAAALDGLKRGGSVVWEHRPSVKAGLESLRQARRAAAVPAIEADGPMVFGGGDEIAIEAEHAAPIVQIAAPKQERRKAKARKDEPAEEQEEFTFALDHDYRLPPTRLLGKHDDRTDGADEKTLVAQSKILEQKLATFGVSGRVVAVRPGPVITTFEFEPDAGIKVSRVVNLSDDLTMALRAHSVRIVAPIPGKNVVGIEVSNRNRAIVGLRDLIDADEFQKAGSPLTLAVGRDTTGTPVYADLAKMPHLLMAGATGTGKSVSLNAMIVSMLCKTTPRDVRFIMIDPKMLEMALYEGIPHLLVPVVTDVKKASAALKNVMREMDRRFELMKEMQVRSVSDYNRKVAEMEEDWEEEEDDEWTDGEEEDEEEYELADDEEWEDEDEDEEDEDEDEDDEEEEGHTHEHLPRIVVIVDELADLMMTVGREVEESITRLAQKARAAGIHLILATQRPSVDVITGLIKANFPSRISFKVTSRPDSRTILDNIGAERLLGNGDMLYVAPGTSFVQRLHGGLISDREIAAVVDYLKKQGGPDYKMELLEMPSKEGGDEEQEEFFDELYDRAVEIVLENGQGSTSWLQRKLGIGYNRAARIMEHMEREGVVGPADGARPRKVIVGSHAMS